MNSEPRERKTGTVATIRQSATPMTSHLWRSDHAAAGS